MSGANIMNSAPLRVCGFASSPRNGAGSRTAPRSIARSTAALPFLLAACLVLLMDHLLPGAAAQAAPKSWIRTERLTDELGQPGYSMSESLSLLGRFSAVGSTTSNRGRGQVVIYYNNGSGVRQVAVLKDPKGGIGEQFGESIRLFVSNGFTQIAVGATQKAKDGRVLVFQKGLADPTQWSFIQELSPPAGTFVSFFGRRILYDGYKLLVSAERRYQSGPRFILSFVNVVGTNNFIQSNGVDPSIDGDPLLVFASVPDRNNTAYFTYETAIADTDFSMNVGQSFAVSGDTMAVGASFREELKYGSGSDGDLVVDGINLLDGAASYNFNSVTVKRGGVLTVDGYDSIRQIGGIMSIKVKTVFLVEEGGEVNVTGAGYSGGPMSFTSGKGALAGQFTGGGGAARDNGLGCAFTDSLTVGLSISNMGGVVAGSVQTSLPFATANGGGGGYGTPGEPGTAVYCGTSGAGGTTYGDTVLSVPYRGSGGGSGVAWSVGSGGAGGNGGGVILISAKKFINHGHIVADGEPGSDGGFYSGGGGGGSGGSIRLVGDTLINRGYIYARGGAGGDRATGSGSGGTSGVVGGKGGMGRIYFDFLLTQSSGIVVPRPNNVTTYLGDVLLYRRNASSKQWSLHAKIPRHPSMMFIGHQVALSGHTLAIASDQLTPVSPTQKIFLIDTTTVTTGMTVPNYTFSVIDRPGATDLGFGHRMAMMNQTLAVAAAGSQGVRGAVYIYQSQNLLTDHSTYTTVVSGNSTAGDQFGRLFDLDFPQLYVSLPGAQDFHAAANSRRSSGNIQVFKFVRNISASNSLVKCEFATVTSNCTLNCTLHLFAQDGVAAGDLNDVPFISPAVDFQAIGVYSFQTTLLTPGVFTINASYRNATVAGPQITVTNPIDVLTSNVTCTPMVTVAGKLVHCTIHTSNHSGEEIAAREFDVSVFLMGDLVEPINGFNTITSAGVYRSPRSLSVFAEPDSTDYPLQFPKVKFVRRGVYSFDVPTSKPGSYAAFVMYKREALEFPNPVVFDAATPEISAVTSSVVCPSFAAPNRTMACILYAKSGDGAPAGTADFAANMSSNTTVNASLRIAGTSTAVDVPVVGVWSLEGRYSLLMVPQSYGELSVRVQIRPGEFLQAATVTVAANYNTTCNVASRVLNSFMLSNQAMQGSTDASVYGVSATGAGYDTVAGVCDRPKI
jgi:hypothetical protein